MYRLAAVVPAFAAAESLGARPVAKVAALLQNMLTEKQAEQEKDDEIKAKLDCWADKSEGTTTALIDESKAAQSEATASLEENSARKAAAEATIKNLKTKKEKLDGELKAEETKWTARNNKFQEEHSGELEDLKALEEAIGQLSKSHPDALAQQKETVLFARRVMKSVMYRHGDLSNSKEVAAFLQQEPEADAAASSPSGVDMGELKNMGSTSYNSESGSILGIMNQIYQNLEGEMGDDYKEHKEAQAAYENLRKTKTDMLDNIATQLTNQREIQADASKKYLIAKDTLGEMAEKLEGAMAFLKELKEKDQASGHEHEERQKMRVEEIKALNTAIGILTSDENRALFDRTTKKPDVSFLQMSQSSFASRRSMAARMLTRVSQKNGSKTLAAVAAAMKLTSFAGIKEKIFGLIEDTVEDLKRQKGEDVTHKDTCTGTFQRIETETHDTTEEKKQFDSQVELLTKNIEKTEQDIADLTAENANLEQELLKASQNREEENSEFQVSTKDNRQAVVVLQKVEEELAKVYKKAGDKALIQSSDVERPDGVEARPEGFSEYKQHSGAGGVLMLLEKIVGETQGLLKETMSAEIESQAAYQRMSLDTRTTIKENTHRVKDLKGQKADFETDRVKTGELSSEAQETIDALASENKTTHDECDFLIANFDLRQDKFDDEIDGLTNAKAMLQGANFENPDEDEE